MKNGLIENLEKKEIRLKNLINIDLEINKYKDKIDSLESEKDNLIGEDPDYKRYNETKRLFRRIDYDKFYNYVSIYSNSNEDVLNIQLKEVLKIRDEKDDVFSKKDWDDLLNILKKELTLFSFNKWIKGIVFVGSNSEKIVLRIEDDSNLEIVKKSYESLIISTINIITKKEFTIEYVV